MKNLASAALALALLMVAFEPVGAMTSVPFGGVIALHSGKCLSVEGASTSPNARVLQDGCSHSTSEQWQLQPNTAGYYQVIGQKSGLCLVVTGASTQQGAQIVQAGCATADSQLWAVTTQGNGYALRAKHSGQCLDVAGISQADAAPLIQYPCSGSANQTFRFERTAFVGAQPVSIVGQQSGQCVSVVGAGTNAGAAIAQQPCTGQTTDSWTLQPTGKAVLVVNRKSGLCLDVIGASQSAGAAVIQWNCTGSVNQQWQLQAFNAAWRLVAVHSGQCLNVYGAGTTPGTAIAQWPCAGDINELWSLHVPLPKAQWSAVVPTTVDPVAAANLPSGRILAWSAENTLSFNSSAGGQTYTEVLDPVGRTESVALVSNTGHDMFCPGTAVLPDGRILVNGGIDSKRTSLYDPQNGSWSTSGVMNVGRGYEGTVALADGSVLTLGGSWSGGTGGKTAERWTPADGSWRVLNGVPEDTIATADTAGLFRADNHLWLQTLSGGRLLHAGPSKRMNWISPLANAGAGSIVSAGLRGDDADSINGNAIAYDVDRLLKVGGSPNYDNSNATASAQTINAAAGGNPVTGRIAPMAYARAFGNSVVLPSGQVVVVGGQTYAVPFSDDNAILVPELWDPASQVFERLPPMATPRNYHSVALLLPDARVWVGGGGLCGGCTTNHANYEILTPPYLLNADGSAASRPSITAVSAASPTLGSALTVTTNRPVSAFALVRLSSVTHSVNNDQRRIPLEGMTNDGSHYRLTLPADPGVAVPGNYMLFAMDASGVPSVAATVRVTAL